jgi:polyisoprenoid-binding protein YceI
LILSFIFLGIAGCILDQKLGKVGFEITGEINREEFGLTWSAVTEAGGVVVGANVKLHMNIQFVKG